MTKAIVIISILLLLISSCSKSDSAKAPKIAPLKIDTSAYYTPTVRHTEYKGRYSVVIGVEIVEKQSKQSFIKLFNQYGFSGNGPSIEQVVLKNISRRKGSVNSEGEMFCIEFKNKNNFELFLKDIKQIEDISTLNIWLANASGQHYKE